MAKFFGAVGYGHDVESAPGVWEKQITEYQYYGDLTHTSREITVGENVNDDLSVGNSVSIIADAFANDNIFAILYVKWAGTLWKVDSVEVQSPRLILRLGGVYDGPRLPETDPAPVAP